LVIGEIAPAAARDLRLIRGVSPQAVLAIHAAGDPRHPEGSGQLFDWLGRELGGDYRVLAPTMPAPDEPHYRPWRDRIEQELATIRDSVILFGHSFGGSVLVKYLAEGSVPVAVRGLFLAEVPYWGPGGWQFDEYDLPDAFADHLPKAPIFLYHSRDDPEVPFTHLGLYAAKLPEATVRAIDGTEHSFTQGLSELVADIRSLEG
jgi:predicted alpha/beta hydrolase family esterase